MTVAVVWTAAWLLSSCWTLDPSNVINLQLDQLTDDCDLTNENKPKRCLVDDDMDAPGYTCWVTSSAVCDGRRYAGDRSVCRHAVSGDVRECRNGRWKGQEQPSAAKTTRVKRWIWAVKCPSPPTLNHGRRSCTGSPSWPHQLYMVGSVCSYSCDAGYSLYGFAQSVTCQPSRRWSSTFPSCQGISCGSPGGVVGGQVSCPQGHTYPFSCVVQCHAGFYPTAPTSFSCASNGVWTHRSSCTGISCGSPGGVVGGQVSCPQGHTYPFSCVVQCHAGFYPTAPTSFSCASNGVWTHRSSCTVTCPAPPPLSHGTRTCAGAAASNVVGSACSHSCRAGYSLYGGAHSHTVRCQSNGTWSSPFPSCSVTCGPPPTGVAGGQMVCPYGHAYPAGCVVQCHAGFDPIPSFSCSSSGIWDQKVHCADVQLPRFPHGCPADQKVFSRPLRAPVTVTWNDPVATDNSGQTVTLTSIPAKGSSLGPGSHSIRITGEDAAGNQESCQFTVTVEAKECEAVRQPANGNVKCTADHVEGSACNVSCNYGYRLKGQAGVTCLDTGQWTAAFPWCEAVICGDLPLVSAGQFACPSGRQCPSVCTLTCATGFQLVCPGNVTCGEDGNWTSPGDCQDIQAPIFDNGCPGNMEVFAARLGQETRVNLTQPAVSDNSGDVIQLSSDVISGSVFADGVTVVTYEAADASGNVNSCHTNVTVTVLDCGVPDLQPRSSQDPSPMETSCPDGHVHGASCALTCRHGYRLQGRDSVTCDRNDVMHPPSMTWQWPGSVSTKPRCLEDRCPPLDPPRNGALSCYHGDEGWHCYMLCESSWDVPALSDGRFLCPNDLSAWIPASVPDCVARVRPGRVRLLADVLYFAGSCNVSMDLIRQKFIAHLRESVFNGACAAMTSCGAENVEVRCSSLPSRTRRHLETDKLMTRLHRFRRHGNMTSHFVFVTFHVTMPYAEDAVSPEEAFQMYRAESHRLLRDLKAKVKTGELSTNDLDLVADETSVWDMEVQAECPPGTVYIVPRHPKRFSCITE